MKCRYCGDKLDLLLIDLGSAPPSNAYLTTETMQMPEKWYPLRVLVCTKCWLAQTEDFTRADELFDAEYAYFSGFSTSWLNHCERYARDMTHRFNLNRNSHVVEIAANDGSLLKFFQDRNIPCTGIEPTARSAQAARNKGIKIIEEFFGVTLAQKLVEQNKPADLTVANNVLAHVTNINDFVSGFTILLKPEGVATFEFPHLMKLIVHKQFDTIYHEHFSYLSFTVIHHIFMTNGLSIFDVEEIGIHGGSLRVFAQPIETGRRPVGPKVAELLERESVAGLCRKEYYQGFQNQANKVKDDLLMFLIETKRKKKSVAAYGAAAKGNTLLNFAGVRPDLLPYVVDKNPAKQGKYMPGSRIPITAEKRIREQKPDFILILPWNIKAEVINQLAYAREWDTQFVTAVPELKIQ